ncbi:lactoylglutathione lyase [Devosia yakushimensis]|uniref:Lactoylglutathione lyase n=1 Tax=Devosia yakushimensis TaxID=470028 RepID=A0ABQ5UG38_9HYPH|nr:VOC family protein [Devosia yakushimensis]GLQ10589.1 lactoylglutathione lyase [Devosia yakushimensis]
MLQGFEHVGMAASDLDRSIAFYCDLLGLRLILRKAAPRGGGELAFLDAGNAQLELICPSPSVTTPVRRLPNTEAGVRHLTFAFENIDIAFQKLVDAGVPVIEPPRDALNQEILNRVAFVLDPDGNIIELAQRS